MPAAAADTGFPTASCRGYSAPRMFPFSQLFPDVAERETLRLRVAADEPDLPEGTYRFVELYCTDAGCDCRRVLLNVVSEHTRRQVATINHAFDIEGPMIGPEGQTALDLLNPQTDLSDACIDRFLTALSDNPAVAARFERHYAMFKAVVDDPSHPARAALPEDDDLDAEFIEPPAPVRRGPKLRRNDPCHCGSGKKYKHCHLRADEVRPRAANAVDASPEALETRWVRELFEFGVKTFGRAFDPFVAYAALGGTGDDVQMQFMVPWSIYVRTFDDKTVVEHFLENPRRPLGLAERAWLEAQTRARLSMWEVARVERGTGIHVHDPFTGDERFVREVMASQSLSVHDVILARIVDYKGFATFGGVHPHPLPPAHGSDAIERARKLLAIPKKPISVERFRADVHDAKLIAAWHAAVASSRKQTSALPELQNTDGDPLLITIDRFDVAAKTFQEATDRLQRIEGVEQNDDNEPGVRTFSFVRPGNAIHKSWDNTIVGSAELTERTLKLESNSIKRADALRTSVEAALAELLTFRIREHTDPRALLPGQDRGPPRTDAIPDHIRVKVLLEYKTTHYATWADDALPGLRGKTPRQAMKSSKGRREVDGILKEMENHEGRLPENERYDFSVIRTELGFEVR